MMVNSRILGCVGIGISLPPPLHRTRLLQTKRGPDFYRRREHGGLNPAGSSPGGSRGQSEARSSPDGGRGVLGNPYSTRNDPYRRTVLRTFDEAASVPESA